MSPDNKELLIYNITIVGAILVASSIFYILTAYPLFIKDWQTLIGAFTALGAALLTVQIMRKQISFEKTKYIDAQKRKSLTAYAQLPDSIEEICDYLCACFKYIDLAGRKDFSDDYVVQVSTAREAEKFTKPTPPKEAMASLKTSIEYLDETTANTVLIIVMSYQIFNTRFSRYYHQRHKSKHDHVQIFKTLLNLYTLSLRVFDHLEDFRNKKIPLEKDELKSALRSIATSNNENYVRKLKDWEHFI